MSTDNPVKAQRGEVAKAITHGVVIQDLLGGTPGMKEAGERYIPKRTGEALKKWEARVNDAILHNAYRRTRDYLAGQVFTKDVQLGEADTTLHELYDSMSHDVDLQGNNLSVWAGRIFCGAMDTGAGLLLVEFPRVTTRTGEGGRLEYQDATGAWLPKTAAADDQNGWRPYFVAIPLKSLLGWRFETVNGKRVLTQLRFMERVLAAPGMFDTSDTYVEQVRVLYPGRYEIWRNAAAAGQAEVWSIYEQGTVSIQEIPLAVFLPGDGHCDGMVSMPPLEDLAHLNRRHWQATAEHNELMRWVRAPGLFMSGAPEGTGDVTWGPGTLTKATNPEAKITPIGVDADSVTASRLELKDLEDAMALYGLQLLMPQTGNVTATEKSLSAAESDSTLKRMALGLKDCLEEAFEYAAQWVGLPEDQAPRVTVNTEYHMLTGVDPTTILLAVDKGVVPKQLAFEEFKRRGLLQDDADWADAVKMFEDQNRMGPGPVGLPSPGQIAARLLGPGQQPGK